MGKVITIIGIDISKRYFQLHGATASGEPVLRRQLTRPKLLGFLAKQPVCGVVMEVCGSAHHWGRVIQEIGHEVRLIPPMSCSAFTSLRPAWSLNRPGRPFVIGVLQPMSLPPSSAPTATGWSDSCRAGFTPAVEWRLSRRTEILR